MINVLRKANTFIVFIGLICAAYFNSLNFFILPNPDILIITLGILYAIAMVQTLYSNKRKVMTKTLFLELIVMFLSGGILWAILKILITSSYIYLAMTIHDFESTIGVRVIKLEIYEDSNVSKEEQINEKLKELAKEINKKEDSK